MIESPESGEPSGLWSRLAQEHLRSPWVMLGSLFSLLGLIALMLAGRGISSAPAVLTAGVILLPVLFGMYALIVGVLGILARSRRLLAMCTAATLIWIGVWGRAWVGDSEHADGEPVTILNWNLQRLAWSQPGGLECIVATLDRIKPDVLSLTELSYQEMETLAERLDLECVHVDYRGTEETGVGGVASCVRDSRWALGYTDRRRFVEDRDWFYSFAEFRRNEQVFNLLTVHLQPYRFGMGEGALPVAQAQAEETDALLRRVSKLNDPTVVAGDFNSPRDAEVHVRMRSHMRDTWEVGGWGPDGTVRLLDLIPMRVDYIYATEDFAVQRSDILDAACSDHRPVLSELILKE